jgi:hypothetical protein
LAKNASISENSLDEVVADDLKEPPMKSTDKATPMEVLMVVTILDSSPLKQYFPGLAKWN